MNECCRRQDDGDVGKYVMLDRLYIKGREFNGS